MSQEKTTPPKRPRKDEIASAAKLLRAEANKLRRYAQGHREMAGKHPDNDSRGTLMKWAAQKERAAERFARIAEWLPHA